MTKIIFKGKIEQSFIKVNIVPTFVDEPVSKGHICPGLLKLSTGCQQISHFGVVLLSLAALLFNILVYINKIFQNTFVKMWQMCQSCVRTHAQPTQEQATHNEMHV